MRIAPTAVLLMALPALAQTSVTFQNRTGGYSGTDDARIVCCDSAGFNEGGNEVIDLIPADVTAYLIRFAILQSEGGLVPAGVTVQSATLSIYKNYGPGAVFALDRLTQPWTEGGVTWISTGSASWASPGGAIDPSGEVRGNANDSIALGCPVTPPVPDACWFSLDVTGLVQGIVSGTANNGWKLSYVSDLDGSVTLSHEPKEFFSSETSRDDSLRPRLTVTYVQETPPQPTNSATMQQGNGYSGMSDARITCCATATVNEGNSTFYALIGETSTSALVRYRIFQREGGPVPDNVAISSAQLKFYKYWGPATTFALKRVLKDWDQATVTWNTTGLNGVGWDAPGAFGPGDVGVTDATATHGDSQAVPCPADEPGPDACWVKFDVTGAVEAFSDGLSNFGWKLVYQSDGDGSTTNMNQPKEMYSSEDSRAPSLRPVLTVSWGGTKATTATTVELYRAYRQSNTDWLFTTDVNEKNAVVQSGEFTDGGIAGYCDTANRGGEVQLFRMYKGPPQNEHFYTTDANEMNSLLPQGYVREGEQQCWVWPTQAPGTAPFHRLVKFDPATGDLVHFYTTSDDEVSLRVGEGFTNEGIQAYIRPPQGTQPDPAACANPAGGYEGFGRNTTGGAGKPVYHVTRLDDFYPDTAPLGTLRDALSQGDRCIVFDVAGTIILKERLRPMGPNITIDGFSAPAGTPSGGITLQGETPTTPSAIVIHGMNTSGNIVIRGIRHRGQKPEDGITIIGRERDDTVHPAVSNVVIDHVSVNGQADGAIDVTEQANHITIQWSILGTGAGDNSHELTLFNYGAWALSAHHNLYIDSTSRMPACYDYDINGPAPRAPGIVCDVRNNLIWNTHQAGTEVRLNATGNVINNFYRPAPDINYNPEQLVAWVRNPPEVVPPLASITSTYYVDGNVVSDPVNRAWDLVPPGNQPAPLDVPDFFRPATSSAEAAAQAVKDQAGARCSKWGLDDTDAAFIGEIQF